VRSLTLPGPLTLPLGAGSSPNGTFCEVRILVFGTRVMVTAAAMKIDRESTSLLGVVFVRHGSNTRPLLAFALVLVWLVCWTSAMVYVSCVVMCNMCDRTCPARNRA